MPRAPLWILITVVCGATPVAAQQSLFTATDPLSTNLGESLVSLGDVNGDGLFDVAATDPVGVGQVVVLSGAGGTVLWRRANPKPNGVFGAAICGMDDVNGDGIRDLLVGAPTSSGQNGWNSGVSWILSGQDGSTILKTAGPTRLAQHGLAVAGVGDLDGDRIPDRMVAEGGTNPRVVVLSGVTNNVIHVLSPDLESYRFGDALAGVGDLDADGIPDLLVGDRMDFAAAAFSGAVHVFSGATGQRIRVHRQPDAYAALGDQVLGMDDVDGDGAADYLISAPGASRSGLVSNGHVSLFSGATGGLLDEREGDVDSARLGFDLGPIGDITGDGVADYGVVAPGSERFRQFRDGATGELLGWDVNQGQRPWVSSFAPMGDLNGDGRGDFVHGRGASLDAEVEARAGDDLFLWSQPRRNKVVLRVRKGPASAMAGVLVTRVDGQQVDRFVALGRLDGDGDWNVPRMTIPPGLGGLRVLFRAYAVSPTGVVSSVVEAVNL